jgi:short/branched chain acyl-CoA dehydrogenase
MDLVGEQHRAVRRVVRDFAEREVRPVSRELDETGRFPLELVRRLGQLGLLGLTIPEAYGGSGGDTVSLAIAIEELARVDSSLAVTVSAGVTLAAGPVSMFGTEDQKRRWLPPLCAGEMLGAFALTEPEAGSDAGETRTRAVLDGDRWVINGRKVFITNSGTPITGFILATVATGEQDGRREISNIIVPRDAPGLQVGPPYRKLGWRASDTREVVFENCIVPAENLLGERGAGFKQALITLDGGRIGIAAMSVGLAQACLEASLSYAQSRRQFGRPIYDFQAVQFKLVDLAVGLEAARLLTYRAAHLKDRGEPYTTAAAMAKLFASELAVRAAAEAVQIHGGLGFMEDGPVARLYRDAKILTIGEGTSEIQRLVIGRRLPAELARFSWLE